MKIRNLSKITGSLEGLLVKLSPQPPIGGLEISDSTIRLVEFQGKRVLRDSLRLPPGVVLKGQVKDREKLKAVLSDLYKRLSVDHAKNLNVVLTIPSVDVFVQTVVLPPMAAGNLEEAAELNMQMISPLNLQESYFSWQKISDEKSNKPIELLGAFAPRSVTDGFVSCLAEVGFTVVAVEFVSLSLVRELNRKNLIDSTKAYLAVDIRVEGITFILIRNHQLIFHSFIPWSVIQGERKTIIVSDFTETLSSEIGNITNFYIGHWSASVDGIIFITPALESEIKQALKEKFQSITFLLPQDVSAAAGAASRSLTKKDQEISLLGISALKIFEQNRLLAVALLWRSILVTAFGFLLLLFLGSDVFLRQLAAETNKTNNVSLSQPDSKELLGLQEQAKKFNQLVALIKGVRSDKSRLGPTIDQINDLAGGSIRINRLYIPSREGQVTITGLASDEQAAVKFKNSLVKEEELTAVELPLSELTPGADGQFSFSIYFKIAGPELSE